MGSIIPFPRQSASPRPALDVRPLAYALSRMTPELTALVLPGETWDDMMTRREAARDILADLLAEYTATAEFAGVEAVAW
jgi:hypothetical protein